MHPHRMRLIAIGARAAEDSASGSIPPLPLSMMRRFAAMLLVATACTRMPAANAPFADGLVRPGLDVFVASVPAEVKGKRVGLITNHSAISRDGRAAIDLIATHPDVRL